MASNMMPISENELTIAMECIGAHSPNAMQLGRYLAPRVAGWWQKVHGRRVLIALGAAGLIILDESDWANPTYSIAG